MAISGHNDTTPADFTSQNQSVHDEKPERVKHIHLKDPNEVLQLRQDYVAKFPDTNAIHFNRPTAQDTPVTLCNQIFGNFVDDCDTHKPTAQDNLLFYLLSSTMTVFFENEDARAAKLRDILRDYDVDATVTTTEGSEYPTDAGANSGPRHDVIVKVKNEIAVQGVDPYAQIQLDYFNATKHEAQLHPTSNFPCILVTVFGAHLSILGAVWNTQPNVQVLCPVLPLFCHVTDYRMQAKGARCIGALKKAILAVRQYYKASVSPSPAAGPDPRVPYPRSYTSRENGTRGFTYLTQLSGKTLYTGKTDEGDTVLIKFTNFYSKEVHLKCVSMGFAPPLRGFETLPGGYYMVLMDFLDDSYQDLDTSPFKASYTEEVYEKIGLMHQAGVVHGDIRSINIMVKKSGEKGIMIIDFDWAGALGEMRYPIYVNRGVGRPPGAFDGELIRAEHDIAMADYIFGVSSPPSG